eukprot:COSAG01_NODE_3511_length_5986_cov_35.145915_3_plen_242_part_00
MMMTMMMVMMQHAVRTDDTTTHKRASRRDAHQIWNCSVRRTAVRARYAAVRGGAPPRSGSGSGRAASACTHRGAASAAAEVAPHPRGVLVIDAAVRASHAAPSCSSTRHARITQVSAGVGTECWLLRNPRNPPPPRRAYRLAPQPRQSKPPGGGYVHAASRHRQEGGEWRVLSLGSPLEVEGVLFPAHELAHRRDQDEVEPVERRQRQLAREVRALRRGSQQPMAARAARSPPPPCVPRRS